MITYTHWPVFKNIDVWALFRSAASSRPLFNDKDCRHFNRISTMTIRPASLFLLRGTIRYSNSFMFIVALQMVIVSVPDVGVHATKGTRQKCTHWYQCPYSISPTNIGFHPILCRIWNEVGSWPAATPAKDQLSEHAPDHSSTHAVYRSAEIHQTRCRRSSCTIITSRASIGSNSEALPRRDMPLGEVQMDLSCQGLKDQKNQVFDNSDQTDQLH